MEKTINIAGHSITLKKQVPSPISKEEIAHLLDTFKAYRNAKEKDDRKVIENENWFKGEHWKYIIGQDKDMIGYRPSGSYLLNGIWHRHAEAMDNFPHPLLLEREEGDRKRADELSKVVPLILEKSDFYSTYSDIWWYKLKQGSGIYGVFWDNSLENGLGDISIKKIDLLRFYSQPHIENIQDSRYIFVLSLCDLDEAQRRYPDVDLKKGSGEMTLKSYFGTQDIRDKALIIDCYEKVRLENGKNIVHLTKIIGDKAVYSSKTDPNLCDCGLYRHGLYPFIVDTLIPVEGSPFGLGMIDVGKNAQAQIDKLEYLIERNALISSRPRFLVKRDCGIDSEKLSDLSVDFIECDRNVDDSAVRPLQANTLPETVLSCRENKIEELKEIIGNRDFTQGDTTKGVTAYAAISALQQAGGKLSRDAISTSYRAFADVVYMVIELISQFYTEARSFRITGEDGISYLSVKGDPNENFSAAIFDIEVAAQKKNMFDALSHNELILELFKNGAFNRENKDAAIAAIGAMVIDNKQGIIRSIERVKGEI